MRSTRLPWAASGARRVVLQAMDQVAAGQIRLVDGQLDHTWGDARDEPVTIHVHDPRAYSSILFGGAVGAAEAYMAGYWHTEDLTRLLRVLLQNRTAIDAMNAGASTLKRLGYRLYHFLRRDTIAGSRRNIVAHYDLGNDFFKLFLDETMMYSAGYFGHEQNSMAEASRQKIDVICQKLALTPSDHVLEIGTGWGGFAVQAAEDYGCRVTTTTISDEQYAYAVAEVQRRGLEDRVTVLRQDYRLLEGSYDKLVSIEMIEAVGLSNLPTFFNVCSRLLKDGGTMLLQSITIADQRYDMASRSVDFIQRYIFPGGALPSVTALADTSSRASDLRIYALEDITSHYARTIENWRAKFQENMGAVREMNFNDNFIRMWWYYLCYCEAGFRERAIGCVHVQLHKPGVGEAI